jgi:kinetochore protein Spc7/SPC105
MKLLEGLKEGLDRHVDEMKSDSTAISKQEELLNRVVPGLVDKHSTLKAEAYNLQQVVEEMQNCDQEALRNAHQRLGSVDTEIAAKKKLLSEMQGDLQEKQRIIQAGAELKAEFLEQIRDAERIREACRGWSAREVNALKGWFTTQPPFT